MAQSAAAAVKRLALDVPSGDTAALGVTVTEVFDHEAVENPFEFNAIFVLASSINNPLHTSVVGS